MYKDKCGIFELLATIGILGNTLILIIFQNTLSYEEVAISEMTPKSTYLTIMQYNPIFAIVYVFCGVVILLCGIYRLIKHKRGDKMR